MKSFLKVLLFGFIGVCFLLTFTTKAAALIKTPRNTIAPSIKNHTGKTLKQQGNTVPGEYIITLSRALSEEEIKRIFSENNVTYVHVISRNSLLFLIKMKNDPGLEALREKIKQYPEVLAIQPNFVYQAF